MLKCFNEILYMLYIHIHYRIRKRIRLWNISRLHINIQINIKKINQFLIYPIIIGQL